MNKNNEYISSSSKMANLLSTQYSSVFSKPSDASTYYTVEENENDPTITDIEFTEQDIIDAIDELKTLQPLVLIV